MPLDSTRSSRKNWRPDPIAEDRAERRVVRFLLCLLALVVTVQVLQRFDVVRRTLNLSIRLEGEPLQRNVVGLESPVYPWLDLSNTTAVTGTIYVRLTQRPKGEVWILVNNRAVKMIEGDGTTLTVRQDDFVEILAQSGEARVLVSSASPNVGFPGTGIWVSGKGRFLLGEVRLR